MFQRPLVISVSNVITTPLGQIFLLCLCVSTVLGMPFADNRNELDKRYEQSYRSSLEDDSDSKADSIFHNMEQPLISIHSLDSMLHEQYDKDKAEDIVYRLETPELIEETRKKRTRLPLFPSHHFPQFLINQRNRRVYQMIDREDIPPVKRRQQYTALRGR